MKYAHIIDTKIKGWYDDSIHSVIPTPNIEVTEELWQGAININANCYENKKFIVKDFRTDEEIENERKQNIYSQISILESETYRPLREQLVGSDSEKLAASLILDNINKQIKNLRSQITATSEEQLLLNESLLVLKSELITLRS